MARFDYGNYDTFLARGMINVPMGDALAARVAYQHREHGSYGRNLSLDRGLGDANSDFVRVSFKLEPPGSRTRTRSSCAISALEESIDSFWQTTQRISAERSRARCSSTGSSSISQIGRAHV